MNTSQKSKLVQNWPIWLLKSIQDYFPELNTDKSVCAIIDKERHKEPFCEV